MNTFIIMWNPVAPGLDYSKYKEWFYDPLEAGIHVALTDWKKAHAGDRVFMVRAGNQGRGGKGNRLFLIEHPHRFTTVASGCSVGVPLGRLLMHLQMYKK